MEYSDIGKGEVSDEDGENKFEIDQYIEGEIIGIGQTPKEKNWKLIPLYSEGENSEVRIWTVGFSIKEPQLKILHGTLITSKGEMGKLQTTIHPVSENKSGRNLQEQALLEARRRYLNKIKEGYIAKGEDLPPHLDGMQPMLANKYKYPPENDGKTNIKKFPVSVMKKIDGIRALSRLQSNKIEMRSRENNLFPHLHHIKDELKKFLFYLPPNSELDGEIYTSNVEFTKLTSIVKRQKTLHPRHNELEYWIFDLIEPNNLIWEKRYNLLVNALKKYIKDGGSFNTFKVLHAHHAESHDDIIKYHDKFVENGFEGIMIRRYGFVEGEKLSQYISKRRNNLLKYKRFVDEEVTIIDYDKCVGTEQGAIKFIVKDERGNIFPVRPKGSIEKRRKWYKNGDKFINKPLTIRYQELSEHGVPRFPVGISVRDYE